MHSSLKRFGWLAAGVLLLVCSAADVAFAQVAPAPEIDGASIAAGLGVLGAGVMMLRARRRNR
jgi:hypothetical protein